MQTDMSKFLDWNCISLKYFKSKQHNFNEGFLSLILEVITLLKLLTLL